MAKARVKTGEGRMLCLGHMDKYLRGNKLSVMGLAPDKQAELRAKYVK